MNTVSAIRPTQYAPKTGKKLMDLAQELENLRDNSKDFLVPVSKLRAESDGKDLNITFENGVKHDVNLNNWSTGQVATYTDIPKSYFDKLRSENPILLADNVNHSLGKIAADMKSKGEKESRLIRTVNGKARAFVSSKYRRLDSYDLVESIWPTVKQAGLVPISQDLTEKKLYLKFVSNDLQTEVKPGDLIRYGLMISNSDVGGGSLRIESFIERLVCSNGLIMPTSMRKNHVERNKASDDIFELLSEGTKNLTEKAFWAQVQEMVQLSLKRENFEEQVERLKVAQKLEIKSDNMEKVVEMAMRSVSLTGKDKKDSILSWMARGNEGAGLTQWGLMNSITRCAQADFVDYDESVELERAAGRILDLNEREWTRIAEAV
jgi:hypothetical protein